MYYAFLHVYSHSAGADNPLGTPYVDKNPSDHFVNWFETIPFPEVSDTFSPFKSSI